MGAGNLQILDSFSSGIFRQASSSSRDFRGDWKVLRTGCAEYPPHIPFSLQIGPTIGHQQKKLGSQSEDNTKFREKYPFM
jgi:hypothetical protein